MKLSDAMDKEKFAALQKASYKIIKDHLEEDITIAAFQSLLKRNKLKDLQHQKVWIFCDGYRQGMTIALALIEAGILNILTLEIENGKAKKT